MKQKAVNILFTSAGRRVQLLRAFKQAYADLGLKGRIVATDIDPLAPALRVVDRSYLVPPVSDPDYVPALVEICQKEEIHLLFPLIDPDIPVLARNRLALEATGARVMVVPEESALIAADKWATYKFFVKNGIPTPHSWLPQDIRKEESLRFPLVVKPRFGSAGKSVFKAHNTQELTFFLDYVSDPIIQEYTSGPEITTDIICDAEGNVLGFVSRQRIEVRSGEVAKGKTVYDPQVAEYSLHIAKALGAIGPINAQCFLHEGEPLFTEINARFGGGAPLGIVAGVLSPHWYLAQAAGLPLEIPPLGTYKVNLYMTRFDEAFFLTREEYEQTPSHRL